MKFSYLAFLNVGEIKQTVNRRKIDTSKRRGLLIGHRIWNRVHTLRRCDDTVRKGSLLEDKHALSNLIGCVSWPTDNTGPLQAEKVFILRYNTHGDCDILKSRELASVHNFV